MSSTVLQRTLLLVLVSILALSSQVGTKHISKFDNNLGDMTSIGLGDVFDLSFHDKKRADMAVLQNAMQHLPAKFLGSRVQ